MMTIQNSQRGIGEATDKLSPQIHSAHYFMPDQKPNNFKTFFTSVCLGKIQNQRVWYDDFLFGAYFSKVKQRCVWILYLIDPEHIIFVYQLIDPVHIIFVYQLAWEKNL